MKKLVSLLLAVMVCLSSVGALAEAVSTVARPSVTTEAVLDMDEEVVHENATEDGTKIESTIAISDEAHEAEEEIDNTDDVITINFTTKDEGSTEQRDAAVKEIAAAARSNNSDTTSYFTGDTTTASAVKEVEDLVVEAVEGETVTETVENEDGSKEETTTTVAADGAKTEVKTVTAADNSKKTTETITLANGDYKTVETDTTAEGKTTTTTTVKVTADNGSTVTKTEQKTEEKTTTKVEEADAEGNTTKTVETVVTAEKEITKTETDAEGNTKVLEVKPATDENGEKSNPVVDAQEEGKSLEMDEIISLSVTEGSETDQLGEDDTLVIPFTFNDTSYTEEDNNFVMAVVNEILEDGTEKTTWYVLNNWLGEDGEIMVEFTKEVLTEMQNKSSFLAFGAVRDAKAEVAIEEVPEEVVEAAEEAPVEEELPAENE